LYNDIELGLTSFLYIFLLNTKRMYGHVLEKSMAGNKKNVKRIIQYWSAIAHPCWCRHAINR